VAIFAGTGFPDPLTKAACERGRAEWTTWLIKTVMARQAQKTASEPFHHVFHYPRAYQWRMPVYNLAQRLPQLEASLQPTKNTGSK
jgi:hypothetical protein